MIRRECTRAWSCGISIAVLFAGAAGARSAAQNNEVVFEARVKGSEVGVSFSLWRDESREESWTGDGGDVREVGVRWYYPSEGGAEDASFFAQGDGVAQAVRRVFGEVVDPVTVRASEGAPVSGEAGSRPVVLLSHGMGGAHWTMTELALELAARGYVVGAIEHPFVSLTSARSNGEVIDPSMTAAIIVGAMPRLALDMAIQDMLRMMSDDQRFVLRQLERASEGAIDDPAPGLGRVSDLSRVIVGGHSVGGMAADLSCLRFRGFHAGFTLDGKRWLPLLAGQPLTPCDKPFLGLFSEAFWEADRRFGARYIAAWSNFAGAVISGSRHDSFVNVASVATRLANAAPAERATHDVMVAIIADFIAAAISDQPFRVAETLQGRGDGVEVINFESMAENAREADLDRLYREQ